jgi:hypothetical protein
VDRFPGRLDPDAAPSGESFLTHLLFPSYIAAFLWGGLYLREGRLAPLRGNARFERLVARG